jgi:hypothetical protein
LSFVTELTQDMERDHFFAKLNRFEQRSSDLGSSLKLIAPYFSPLLAGLLLAVKTKPIKELLSYLQDNKGWEWYRIHGTQTGLGASATFDDVVRRLREMSMLGKPDRDFVVKELLPAAFIADLFDALLETDPSHAWSKVANVVFFLDGFEALQLASSITATRLLQVLTTEQRRDGKTDPLLLVVGSREYLPGSGGRADRHVPFQRTVLQDEREVQRSVREWYTQWQRRLPAGNSYHLTDLYLTLEPEDFGKEDARGYLLKLGEQKQSRVFADNNALIQAIDRLTHGHPLYLVLAAEAVLEAEARGQNLTPDDFERAKIPPEIVPEHEGEPIRDYLLNLFLRQLSDAERKELIFCAVPRFLNAALLRILLPMVDNIDRPKRWNYYQRLTFMQPVDDSRIVFHPLVRTLLLRQLPADEAPESDYHRIHSSLKDYFHNLVNQQRGAQSLEATMGQAQIEEVYHALALGDPNPAIALGVFAQRGNLTLWEPFLEAVAQAPVELISENAEQQAYDALVRAERHHNVQDVVRAIVLCTWLLTAAQGILEKTAYLQNNLGSAYSNLPGGDREANLRQAIACYEAALQIFQEAHVDYYASVVNSNLEIASDELGSLEH